VDVEGRAGDLLIDSSNIYRSIGRHRYRLCISNEGRDILVLRRGFRFVESFMTYECVVKKTIGKKRGPHIFSGMFPEVSKEVLKTWEIAIWVPAKYSYSELSKLHGAEP
jgi:hypothetical protein